MYTQALLTVVAAASTAFAAPTVTRKQAASSADLKCPIVFDGRVPNKTPPTFFDTTATNTIFSADWVKGNNLTWSQILKFPKEKSRFDGKNFTAVEVTISDQSIFLKQTGFRRAGLQFANDTPDGEGQQGIKTFHWSVKQDPKRPLNLTHEYLNVWHETADFSANQIQFQAGSLIGKPATDKANFKILDREGKQLFTVPIEKTQWQNFAATLDYTRNLTTIFYSKGSAPLKVTGAPQQVNLAGGGQFQIGLLKKPTGTDDVANGGFQEKNLNEGQIYGGLFVEDSKDGCVSL